MFWLFVLSLYNNNLVVLSLLLAAAYCGRWRLNPHADPHPDHREALVSSALPSHRPRHWEQAGVRQVSGGHLRVIPLHRVQCTGMQPLSGRHLHSGRERCSAMPPLSETLSSPFYRENSLHVHHWSLVCVSARQLLSGWKVSAPLIMSARVGRPKERKWNRGCALPAMSAWHLFHRDVRLSEVPSSHRLPCFGLNSADQRHKEDW